ncbi:uncharacterized protein [Amphiura filiformis]|uniref:uncharacterized protein n=1 Tax=Amphiura filiformis TaxID=82378 RepID=UPI003B213593
MDEISNEPKQRIFLWTIPRSLATVFTKCMSFAEGVQIINEPYVTAHIFGPECTAAEDDEMHQTFTKGIATPVSQAANVDLSFHESIATFKWVKQMLESPFPGYFLHGRGWCLHIMPSFIDKPFTDLPKYLVPAKLGYGEVCDLMGHVKDKLVQSPIVIDADDLQANPASVLRQYCHLLGVEFKESMLQWEAGDKIVDTWIISKAQKQGNKMKEGGGFYEDAFKSTEFHPPKELPSREQIDPDLLPLIDQCMPLYEKMYSMRIRPLNV